MFRVGGGRGWGLRAAKAVPQGTPVAIYCGELLVMEAADTRSNDQYMFSLDLKPDLLEVSTFKHYYNVRPNYVLRSYFVYEGQTQCSIKLEFFFSCSNFMLNVLIQIIVTTLTISSKILLVRLGSKNIIA